MHLLRVERARTIPRGIRRRFFRPAPENPELRGVPATSSQRFLRRFTGPTIAGTRGNRSDITCPRRGAILFFEMGELLEPKSGVWCRQRWCRLNGAREAEHFDGDGCSCHGQLGAVGDSRATDADEMEPGGSVPTPAIAPRLTILTAKASRLAAFACRACGRNTRRMIEAPEMFFRCEECARSGHWPPSRRHA